MFLKTQMTTLIFLDRRSTLFRIVFIGIVVIFVINFWILFIYFPTPTTMSSSSSSSQMMLSQHGAVANSGAHTSFHRDTQQIHPEEQQQPRRTTITTKTIYNKNLTINKNENETSIDCPFFGCPIYPPELTNSEFNQSILKKILVGEEESGNTDKNFRFATDSFATLTQQGKSHSINQDRAVYIYPFLPKLLLSSLSSAANATTTTSISFLAAIFDGHGTLGHDVAQEVVERFPLILAEKLTIALGRIPFSGNNVDKSKSSSRSSSAGNQNNINRRIKQYDQTDFAIRKALNETFLKVNNDGTASTFSLGGCTASVTLRWGSKLYVANAGDSQTILVSSVVPSSSSSLSSTKQQQQQFTPEGMITKVVYSSRRDKANLLDEIARIEGMGGNIHLNANGFDPRVIVHSKVANDTIGLAMSRCIGDWEWKAVGVIAEPIIDVIDLSKLRQHQQPLEEEEDKQIIFLIAASDGFFDIRSKEFYANQLAGSFLVDNDNDADRKYITDPQRKQGISLGNGNSNFGITKAEFRPLFRLYDIIQRITPKVQTGYRDDITAIISRL